MKEVAIKLMHNFYVKLIDEDELLVKTVDMNLLHGMCISLNVHIEPINVDTYRLTKS